MVEVHCQTCNKPFFVKKSFVERGWGKYCSRQCVFRSQKKGRLISCFNCGKEIYKSPKDLNGSVSGNFFCTKSCQTIWRNHIYSGPKHSNWKSGESSYRNQLIRSSVTKNCAICKTDDVRVLAAHHIDMNRKNNEAKNLIWLCHNCHYLIHHYNKEKEKLMEALV